jgi:phage tail-like protein
MADRLEQHLGVAAGQRERAMSGDKQQRYRFSTPAQWNACLFTQTDSESLAAGGGVRPLPPFASTPTLFAAQSAFAPAVTRAGEIVLVDHEHSLIRLAPSSDQPMAGAAPRALARANRIVATENALWIRNDSADGLDAFDVETLTRIATVDLAPRHVIDLASDGPGAVVALVRSAHGIEAVRVDRTGRVIGTVTLEGVARAAAFVYLRQTKRFVILANDRQQRLCWFAETGARPLTTVAVGAMHPCFTANVLGSDSRSRIFVGGANGDADGGRSFVLIFDADALAIDEVAIDPLDAPITGIAATRDQIFITGARGLLRFDVSQVVPDGASPMQCQLLTPMLSSPDREDARRWLRIDATAQLAAGAALEISFAATEQQITADRLNAIAADVSLPASRRIEMIRSEPDVWSETTVFQGTGTSAEPASYSARLFDVHEPHVWVSVRLIASATAQLPALRQLDVLYPGLSLMQQLPAIYQRDEARPGSFLRSFVGVVEATTQDIDARIGAMGSRIDPSTAPVEWLDFVARWLGVPWDDGLSVPQKRAILTNAPALLKARGTRAAVELLLASLIPGTPLRFRVTDATADVGFVILGGAGAAGGALPALLGGSTMWTTTLDATSRVGCMRLPCDGQSVDGALPFAGTVQVEVAASAAERTAWEPWLRALIAEMMPLTARLQFRWVGLDALRSDRLDGSFVLTSTTDPTVGTDTVTNVARLPERGTRLSASGASLSARLL